MLIACRQCLDGSARPHVHCYLHAPTPYEGEWRVFVSETVITRHHGRSLAPTGRPHVDKQRPRRIIRADMVRGSGSGLAVMQSGGRFPAAPLIAKSKTSIVSWGVASPPRLITRPPFWPAVTRRGLATALHHLWEGPRRPPSAPDCLSLLTGSVASPPQGERSEQDEGRSQCGAPALVAVDLAPIPAQHACRMSSAAVCAQRR
jgi:hypothetical protein